MRECPIEDGSRPDRRCRQRRAARGETAEGPRSAAGQADDAVEHRRPAGRAPRSSEIVVSLPAGASPPEGVTGVRGGTVRSESVRLALAAAGAGRPRARPRRRPPAAGGGAGRSACWRRWRATPRSTRPSPQPPSATRSSAPTPGAGCSRRWSAAGLWAVQTPQVFRRDALERALAVRPRGARPGNRRRLADRAAGWQRGGRGVQRAELQGHHRTRTCGWPSWCWPSARAGSADPD